MLIKQWNMMLAEVQELLDRLKEVTTKLSDGREDGREDSPFRLVFDSTCPRIEVRSLEELHEFRRMAKAAFGTYEDKIGIVWASGGDMWASFSSPQLLPLQIWLCMPVEVFPVEKITGKKGCRIEKHTSTNTSYYVACDLEG